MADVWNEWFVKDSADEGPFTWAELQELAKKGSLKPSRLVLAGRKGNWIRASSVQGLFEGAPSTRKSREGIVSPKSHAPSTKRHTSVPQPALLLIASLAFLALLIVVFAVVKYQAYRNARDAAGDELAAALEEAEQRLDKTGAIDQTLEVRLTNAERSAKAFGEIYSHLLPRSRKLLEQAEAKRATELAKRKQEEQVRAAEEQKIRDEVERKRRVEEAKQRQQEEQNRLQAEQERRERDRRAKEAEDAKPIIARAIEELKANISQRESTLAYIVLTNRNWAATQEAYVARFSIMFPSDAGTNELKKIYLESKEKRDKLEIDTQLEIENSKSQLRTLEARLQAIANAK